MRARRSGPSRSTYASHASGRCSRLAQDGRGPSREAEEARRRSSTPARGRSTSTFARCTRSGSSPSRRAGRFLENYLMVRSQQPLAGGTGRERYGYLEQNFDKTLLQLFSEVTVLGEAALRDPVRGDGHRRAPRALPLPARERHARGARLQLDPRRARALRSAASSPSGSTTSTARSMYPGMTKLTWAIQGVPSTSSSRTCAACTAPSVASSSSLLPPLEASSSAPREDVPAGRGRRGRRRSSRSRRSRSTRRTSSSRSSRRTTRWCASKLSSSTSRDARS